MNTVEIAVTRAGPEAAATLAELHGLCVDTPWDVKSMAGLFSTPGTLGLIARMEDRAVGFALCCRASDESELLALGVLPRRRRSGIARVLLDAAIAALVEDGVDALFLEVAEVNVAGRALYDAAGFTVVGRRANYYRRAGAAPSAALVLRRDIRPSEGA